MKQIFKNLTIADKILNLSVMILAICIWAFSLRGLAYKGEKIAIIEYRQQKLYTIDLDKKNGSYSFNFGNKVGYYEIRDGDIRLLEMSKQICPNSICSDTGWIRYPGQIIVCSPNQLIVKIQGSGNIQNEIDSISY